MLLLDHVEDGNNSASSLGDTEGQAGDDPQQPSVPAVKDKSKRKMKIMKRDSSVGSNAPCRDADVVVGALLCDGVWLGALLEDGLFPFLHSKNAQICRSAALMNTLPFLFQWVWWLCAC